MEISVVVAVIGILAALALPSLFSAMPKARLSSATQTLANEIAMARMSAIAKSVDVEVVFNPADDSYALRQTVGGAGYASSRLGAHTDLQALTYLSDGAAAPNSLQINATGTTSVPLQKEAVVITLQSLKESSARKRVLVYATGRIQSQKWAGGTSWVVD